MKTIAFIGIGLMGLPMAKNLLKAGYSLKVYNRTLIKSESLRKYKAIVTKSIKEAVSETDVVITMLSDDEAVNAIITNDDFLVLCVFLHCLQFYLEAGYCCQAITAA